MLKDHVKYSIPRSFSHKPSIVVYKSTFIHLELSSSDYFAFKENLTLTTAITKYYVIN